MSDTQTSRLKYLLDQFAVNALTEGEFAELFALMGRSENEGEVKMVLATDLEAQMPGSYDRVYWAEKFRELGVGREQVNGVLRQAQDDAPVQRMFNWRRIAVAASILLVVGLGSYFLFFNKGAKQPEIVKTTPQDVKAPEINRAMITLANGDKIYLDSAGNGTLATVGNVRVVKNANGEIEYNRESTIVNGELQYNTLFNPRGSKVQPLTLSDGTKVWLNSESSLKYPTAFVGNMREVEITGEAYFEVSKDATKKFIVIGNGVRTEVLGTHFNVNSYKDEGDIKITLLEGSVKVVHRDPSTGSGSIVIKPGQQAQVGNSVKVINGVDVEAVMAWKNGYFQLSGSNLQAIMRQLERWYDIEVVYEAAISQRRFGGQLPRTASLLEVLKILEESDMHFRIEGRKVVVK